jgi:proteasome lid subunit RPN8/RPN11
MTLLVEKKFAVDVVYNGVTKVLHVTPDERVSAVLQKAIAEFGITQAPHMLSLFRTDGTVVDESQTVEQAHLKPGEMLLLRQNVVKGGTECLRVAGEVLPATFRLLRNCGRGDCECVVYWTGTASDRIVDQVEHPAHKRSPFGYELESEWLTQFWKSLAENKRSVKAQVHTHPHRAFHSNTDDRWPIVAQEGFISIVIPDFATGRPTLDGAWVGAMLRDGRWQREVEASRLLVMS